MPELVEVRDKQKKPPSRCGRLNAAGGLPCREAPVAALVLNCDGIRVRTVACATHRDELNRDEPDSILSEWEL